MRDVARERSVWCGWEHIDWCDWRHINVVRLGADRCGCRQIVVLWLGMHWCDVAGLHIGVIWLGTDWCGEAGITCV